MKSRILAAMLVIAITMSACRFVTNLTGGGGDSSIYQYIFETPTNPIKLTVSLDKDHSAEAVIGMEGGTLSTTGADGTVYKLDIPAKALVSGTKITMTPVASLSGPPFDGKQTYTVQLEPEGLYLYEDAILTITPTNPIPIDKQLFFSYKGDGNTVGLAAPVVESKDLKIRLMHFSGYGVSAEISAEGNGNPADSGSRDVYLSDTAAIQGQLGGDTLTAVESLAGEVEAQKRQNEQNGASEDVSAEVQAILDLIDQYEQQEVAPALESAGDSCEAGKDAIGKVLHLERARQLMGISSGMSEKAAADLQALISKASINCVKQEYQRCVDEHHINGMIPLYVGLMRMHALLGGEGGPEPEELQVAKDLTTKCLTFELQFHSEGSFDTGDGGYKSAVDGKITLHFDPDTFTISGSGPLDNLSFEFRPPAGGSGMKCTAENRTGGSTFEAKTLEYIEDTRSETDPEPYVRDFKLLYFPGVTSESYNIHCTLTDSQKHVTYEDYAAPPSGYWTGIFFVLHQDELNGAGPGMGVPSMPDMSGLQVGALPAMPAPVMPEDGGFLATDWEVTPGDALMASKEWIKDDSATSTTETGTLKLYHKPGG